MRIDRLTESELVALQAKLRKQLKATKPGDKGRASLEQDEQRVRYRIAEIRLAAIEAPEPPRRPDPHLGRRSEPEIDPVRMLPAPRTYVPRPTQIVAPPPKRVVELMPIPATPRKPPRALSPTPRVSAWTSKRWVTQALAPPLPFRKSEEKRDPIGRYPVNPCQRCGKNIDASPLMLLMSGERPKMHEACRHEAEKEREAPRGNVGLEGLVRSASERRALRPSRPMPESRNEQLARIAAERETLRQERLLPKQCAKCWRVFYPPPQMPPSRWALVKRCDRCPWRKGRSA